MKMNSNNLIRLWRTNRWIPQFYTLFAAGESATGGPALHASPFFRAAVAKEFPIDTCNPIYAKQTQFSADHANYNSHNVRNLQRKKTLVNIKKQTQFKANPNPIWIYSLHWLAFLLLDRYIVDRWGRYAGQRACRMIVNAY